MDESDCRILIIDDEISLLKGLVAFFKDEEFSVRGSHQGRSGLNVWRTC